MCVKILKKWLNFKVLGNQARPNGFAREVRRVASQRHVEWRCWSSSRVYRESRSFGGPVLLCLSLYVGRDGHTTMAMEVLVRRTTPRLLNLVPVCTRPNRTVRKEKHDRSSKTWRLRKSTWVKILFFFQNKKFGFFSHFIVEMSECRAKRGEWRVKGVGMTWCEKLAGWRTF